MKVLYKQTQSVAALDAAGVCNCCLKQIDFAHDMGTTSKKEHYHGSFELHMVETGCQSYCIGGRDYPVEGGSFLLIPPGVKHRVSQVAPRTQKFSVIFDADAGSPFRNIRDIHMGKTDIRIRENIAAVCQERKKQGYFSRALMEGRIFETLVLLLRLCGAEDMKPVDQNQAGEDARLSLAKQYIRDNIESDLKVPDVAAYCYLSTKQLTRIFQSCDTLTPMGYIQQQRTAHIARLLEQTELSLSQISERMHFSSEYYFNVFFKKHAGMTPGAYRKMMK